MEICISLRGSLKKFFDGETERNVQVPSNCTAAEALCSVGIDWTQVKNFGFVAINGKRVMIDTPLAPGDQLKAYPKISGG